MCTAVNDRSHETTHSDTQQGTTFTMTVTFSVMFTKAFKIVGFEIYFSIASSVFRTLNLSYVQRGLWN